MDKGRANDRKEWPTFPRFPTGANVSFLENCNGKRVAIVCIGNCKGKTKAQIHAMLVHEAVHVWQASGNSPVMTLTASGVNAYAVTGS